MLRHLPLLGLLPACGGATPLPELWQDALDRLVREDPSVPGAALSVRYGDTRFTGVAGTVGLDQAGPLRADSLFRVASVTKTFVSAALLIHVERGDLSLDDPISAHLSEGSLARLAEDGYNIRGMTVRMLLDHTAGIYDYTNAPAFYERLLDDPTHRWTRDEQLALAMSAGSRLNPPGAEYHYGDTHYILAGEVLERLGDGTLAGSLRASLDLDGHGLSSIYLESMESPPEADAPERLTHPSIGDLDTHGWDPSWDLYGGGGLVAGVADLTAWMDALFGGEVFAEPTTLEALLEMPEAGRGALSGLDGGLGINRFFYGDIECFAGLGYFTTWTVRCPDLDLTFSSAQNQSEPEAPDGLVVEVIGSVAD